MQKPTLLSGIQPSGVIHIGNYLGAIKQWVELQKTHHVFAMIADLHAITIPQEPEKLRENTLRMVKLLVACGISAKGGSVSDGNPDESVLFVQSHVPAHTELGWILNTITPLGELERMTQFKEKQEKSGLYAGLLNYPTLMAADILLYQTEVVPVGEDQEQHLELTRTLANKFNNRFGETFIVPKALIQKDTARIMGLDDSSKKMSKSATSANNYISLLDEPDEIRRKIKIAVTDSDGTVRYDEEHKTGIANLMRIYRAFSDKPLEEIENKYAGKGYANFKSGLADLLIEKLEPIQKKYEELTKDESGIMDILMAGAKHANSVAESSLATAKKNVGFLARE
ncbi:MAG: tryptophan--tRNA ligase [bacterium]|nr:tryptophan--tRNA ligase [bacterium]